MEKHHMLANLLVDILPLLTRKLSQRQSMPIPFNQFMVLLILQAYGAVNLSEIAHMMRISKQQMSPIVNRLFDNGYVRKKPDRKDRRVTLVSLTQSGLDFLANHHQFMAQSIEKNLHVLSDEEIDEFIIKFGRCVELLRKLP